MAEVHSIHSLEEFENLKSKHKYILIDFWADWCPPCKAIAPFYANLAKKHGVPDVFAFAKVDTEEVPEISQEYGITSLPSFLVLRDGKPQGVEADVEALGRGAVVAGGEVGLIRGADPKSLTFLATKLNELAAPKKETAEEAKDETTEAS